MKETPRATPDASPWQAVAPWRWLTLPAAVFVARLATLHLSSFGWQQGFNEAFYTIVAQGFRTGHLLTASFRGRPFYDTPPLTTWSMAASFRVFGVCEWAARLPALLMLVPTLLGVWLVAGRLYGRKAAVRAVCLASTAPWVLLWFGRAQTDPYMAAALAICLAGLVNLDLRWGAPLAAVSFAFGLMAKQPMLVALLAVPFLGDAKRKGAKALAAGLVVPLLWWAFQIVSHGGAVEASYVFHATQRAPWFINWGMAIFLGVVIGAGTCLLLLAGLAVEGGAVSPALTARRRWPLELLAPALALIAFAIAQSPIGHDYYTLPAIPVLAMVAGQVKLNMRVFAVLIAVNLVVGALYVEYYGDLGHDRVRRMGQALPHEGTIYVPGRLGPQLDFYSGRLTNWGHQPDPSTHPEAYIVSSSALPGCKLKSTATDGPWWLGLYWCGSGPEPS